MVDPDRLKAYQAFSRPLRSPHLHVEIEGPVPAFHVSPAAAGPVSRRSFDDGAAPGTKVFLKKLPYGHPPHPGDVQGN